MKDFVSRFSSIKGAMRTFQPDHVFGLPGNTIERVYAVQSGLVSLVVHLNSGEQIETGMVGPGGLVGASALAGAKWPNVYVTQSPVTAWEMAAGEFISAISENSELHNLAFRHVQWLMVQAQQATACSSTHDLEGRLSAWLLRARDLTMWIEIPFTQEIISKLIGVQRPTVSLVMSELRREGLISYTRGRIRLIDTGRLEHRACECLTTLRSRHQDIFGSAVQASGRP
jgi:CRP-like cAMP-binding protein